MSSPRRYGRIPNELQQTIAEYIYSARSQTGASESFNYKNCKLRPSYIPFVPPWLTIRFLRYWMLLTSRENKFLITPLAFCDIRVLVARLLRRLCPSLIKCFQSFLFFTDWTAKNSSLKKPTSSRYSVCNNPNYNSSMKYAIQMAIKITWDYFGAIFEGRFIWQVLCFEMSQHFVAAVVTSSREGKSCFFFATLKRLTAFSPKLIVRINRISCQVWKMSTLLKSLVSSSRYYFEFNLPIFSHKMSVWSPR